MINYKRSIEKLVPEAAITAIRIWQNSHAICKRSFISLLSQIMSGDENPLIIIIEPSRYD
jgi:hypothetical protein